ncbi:MAG: hypothetical protein M3008_08650 [Chloroflexota bacterium]|nr:hypothetical protein [Chloroflexota bacterium]
MKFFLPGAEDDTVDAEKNYEAIKRFVEETTTWGTSKRRVFSVAYHHEGTNYVAQVGKREVRTGETVIAIFDSMTYLVCTPNRGVLRGDPIMIGENEVDSFVDFDAEM